MKNYSLKCCCFGFFWGVVCQLHAAHLHLPASLIYQNRPLNPLCLLKASNHKKGVDLKQCENQESQTQYTKAYNRLFTSKGYIGYDYKIKKEATSERGYCYYKPIEQIGNSTLFLMYNNGGGSGQFSSIGSLHRYDKQIKVVTIAGGDRCNRGIVDAGVVHDSSGRYLRYQINLTPYEMIRTALDNSDSPMQTNQLEDCSVCCVARAEFQSPVGREMQTKTLISVHLLPQKNESGDQQNPQQRCFDQLIRPYQKNHHFRLSPQELSLLFQKFVQECTKST